MFYVGLDLGQSQDHSAIAVVERRQAHWNRSHTAQPAAAYEVRGVQRVPLGSSYPAVVTRVRDLLNRDELRGQCCLIVDSTGVGAPVVDLLRNALTGPRGVAPEIVAVTITNGERANENRSGFGVLRWNVPKRDLISGVQVLLERNELRIARDMREAGALVKELLDIRASTKATGRVKVGAEGTGEHDDLVIALALACWRAQRSNAGVGPASGGSRLPGI